MEGYDESISVSQSAESILKRYGSRSIREIISLSGVKLVWEPGDYVVSGVRYFSEFYEKRKLFVLYKKSVRLWAEENKLTEAEAVDFILSHEFYHYLECTELGLTAKQYLVPTIKLGRLVIARSGVRALSEIGAHGFARRFFADNTLTKIEEADRRQYE